MNCFSFPAVYHCVCGESVHEEGYCRRGYPSGKQATGVFVVLVRSAAILDRNAGSGKQLGPGDSLSDGQCC